MNADAWDEWPGRYFTSMDWDVWAQFRRLYKIEYSHAFCWDHAHRQYGGPSAKARAAKILDDFEQFRALERLKGN